MEKTPQAPTQGNVMSNRFVLALLATTSLITGLVTSLAGPALAQASASSDTAGTAPRTQATADGQGLEKVVVTARKREEAAQTVPISITLANTGKQVQSLFTLVHAQFALTNSLLQYVLTCVVEPPEEVLPAARARAKARYAKILRLAGEEVATRNQATLEQVLTHSK